MELNEKIRAARLEAGLQQRDIAQHFGITPEAVSQWEAPGGTGPKRERLRALAKLLKKPSTYFLPGEDENEIDVNVSLSDAARPLQASGEFQNEVSREGVPEYPLPSSMPRDLPVMGSAQCGDGIGDFELNGQIMDRVRRPPALAGVSGAFAIYVSGDSMKDRFEDGELVFVHPGRPVTQGRYVLVELHNGPDELCGPALIKRFISQSSEKVVLEQLNPPKRITIPRAKVKRVLPILRTDELFRF